MSGHKGGVLEEHVTNLNSKVPGTFPSWIMVQIAIEASEDAILTGDFEKVASILGLSHVSRCFSRAQ